MSQCESFLPQERKRKRVKRSVVSPAIPGIARLLKFSFKRLQADYPQFQIAQCSADYLAALLQRLKYYEAMSVDDFVQEDHRESRHTIVWEDTTIKTGFPHIDPNELGVDVAWQFCLQDGTGDSHQVWRVHGFVADDTFNVVWLDPHHSLAKKLTKPKRKQE